MYELPKHKNRKEIPEYHIWKAMRARCSKGCKSNQTYKDKNIEVCDEWNDFVAFYNDMGPRPSEKHSIDREDNNKGYSKSNCRWATQKTQCENRGNFNLVFVYNNKPMVLKAIAKEVKISYTTLRHRIVKQNMSLEDAIKFIDKKYLVNGEPKDLVEICNEYSLSYSALNTYVNRHKDVHIKKVLEKYNVFIDDIVYSA